MTNDVGTCRDMCWDRPDLRHRIMFSIRNVYAKSLDLRLSFVLKMWINLLRGCQTLHRNWIVIKIAFGFVVKHAVRHSQSRWDLPLSNWERYLWAPQVIGSINAWPCYTRLRVNLVRDPNHMIEKERSAWKLDQISWGKGNSMYMTLWWFVRYDFCIHIGVDMSC